MRRAHDADRALPERANKGPGPHDVSFEGDVLEFARGGGALHRVVIGHEHAVGPEGGDGEGHLVATEIAVLDGVVRIPAQQGNGRADRCGRGHDRTAIRHDQAVDDDGVVAALRQQQALGAVAAVSPAMGRHAARGDIVRHPQFAAAAFDDAAADRRRDADEAAIHDRLLRHVLIDGGPVSGGIPEIVEPATVDDQLLAAAVMQRRRIVGVVVASDEPDVADHRARAGGVVVQRARAVAAEIRRDQPEAVDHRGDPARDLDHLLAAVVVVRGERIVVVRVVEIHRDVHLPADDRPQRRGDIRLGERLEQGEIVHPDIVVVAVAGENRLVRVDVASRDRLGLARAGEAAIERQIF